MASLGHIWYNSSINSFQQKICSVKKPRKDGTNGKKKPGHYVLQITNDIRGNEAATVYSNLEQPLCKVWSFLSRVMETRNSELVPLC